MRNIIWCISTGYEHMLPGAAQQRALHLGSLSSDSETYSGVYVWKGQSCGISSAVMPPYAYIPKGVPTSELIETKPEQPSR